MNEISPYLKELLVPGKMIFWKHSLGNAIFLVLTAREDATGNNLWFDVEGLVFYAQKTFKKVWNIHSSSAMNEAPWLHFSEVKR